MKRRLPLPAAIAALALTACSSAEDAQACALMEEPHEAYQSVMAGGGLAELLEADRMAHLHSAKALQLTLEDQDLVNILQETHDSTGILEGTDPADAESVGGMILVAGTVEYCDDQGLKE